MVFIRERMRDEKEYEIYKQKKSYRNGRASDQKRRSLREV